MDIGDKKASEKTSQALREKINEDTPGPKAPLGSGVLLPNPASYLADALSGSTSATPATKTETTEDGAYTTMTVEESKAETLVNDVSTVVKEQV